MKSEGKDCTCQQIPHLYRVFHQCLRSSPSGAFMVCHVGVGYVQVVRAASALVQALYRLGWPTNPPRVGQSFLAERLGMTLTSRLRTPPR